MQSLRRPYNIQHIHLGNDTYIQHTRTIPFSFALHFNLHLIGHRRSLAERGKLVEVRGRVRLDEEPRVVERLEDVLS